MNQWQIGLVIAPPMIIAMALLLHARRAISRTALVLAVTVTAAFTALLFSM